MLRVGLLVLLTTLISCKESGKNGGSPTGAQGVPTYSGSVGGVTTSGTCSFEDNTNVGGTLAMSCDLRNNQFRYLFIAEMINTTTGYADMTEMPTGQRVRVEITWHDGTGVYPPSGFDLTTNPFGSPVSYRFIRQ